MINILFVCTGNTCRSPMAEALVKHKRSDVKVKSAGVFASNGSPASTNTLKVLEEKGITCSHSSYQLTKELVHWADYIFTMTTGHKRQIGDSFPEALDKTFTLKEFINIQNHDVVDPFGGSIEIYRETYTELEEAIDMLLKKLDKQ